MHAQHIGLVLGAQKDRHIEKRTYGTSISLRVLGKQDIEKHTQQMALIEGAWKDRYVGKCTLLSLWVLRRRDNCFIIYVDAVDDKIIDGDLTI